MTEREENLETWNALAETDPAHTKVVSFGRQFTAIDPMYQVMRFTEHFGEIGKYWSWSAVNSHIELDENTIMAYSDVTLHAEANGMWGPFRGAALLKTKTSAGKIKIDHDAWKKATTDALTKLMSHTGLSADVFMGKFDDNKYVQEVQQKIRRRVNEDAEALTSQIIAEINAAETAEALAEVVKGRRDDFDKIKATEKAHARRISAARERRGEELKGE